MSVTKRGFKELRQKLRRLAPEARKEFETINRRNAEDVASLARILISSPSGRSRAAIKTSPGPEGGTLIDFGPLAKILEGGTAERSTKAGASRGKGPKRPFVNPSFEPTKRRRQARNRRAVRKVLKNA